MYLRLPTSTTLSPSYPRASPLIHTRPTLTLVSRGKLADTEVLPYDIYPQPSAIILTVRLLTLSESTAHPLAEIPRFDIFLKSRFLLWCTLDAQVTGDSLVILTCHDRSCEFDEIHLVYWREGTVHCVGILSVQPGRTTNNIPVAPKPSQHVFPSSYLSLQGYPRSGAKGRQRSRVVPDPSERPARPGDTRCPRPASAAARYIMRDGRVPGRPNRDISRPSHELPPPPIRQRSQCDRPVLHPRLPESLRRLRLSPICLLLGPAQLAV